MKIIDSALLWIEGKYYEVKCTDVYKTNDTFDAVIQNSGNILKYHVVIIKTDDIIYLESVEANLCQQKKGSNFDLNRL